MDIIQWLEEWYLSQCDGDWEHGYGIKIETLDNPGWGVEINLMDTYLENKDFTSVQVERNDDDWLFCKVENNTFTASGGPKNLHEILVKFKEWSTI
ncbi:immunity 53 family protein [Paenibacillus sp. MAH-36]|uniref:Immunity 53 family protein n=1 Tax=Paenibacillus violae TaxID=3077234 RepID=A0ABU3RQE8_9BACL|nr:immunity 53 family protein [Paenibacillus sp. PFR10]MDU0206500.1 immunity 53 family protein [Paenibacillus sp. PFR10]